MVERLKPGGIFLFNTPYGVDEVVAPAAGSAGDAEPEKRALYCQRREDRPRKCSLGARINTVMQMAFFHLTQILPGDSALAELQGAIAVTAAKVRPRLNATGRRWRWRANRWPVPLRPVDASSPNRPPVVSDAAPDFVKTVTAAMLAGLGDALPVSLCRRMAPPMGTTRWENAISPKRSPSGRRAVHPV